MNTPEQDEKATGALSAQECRRAEALWSQALAAGRAVVPPPDQLPYAGDREEAQRRALLAEVATEHSWSAQEQDLVGRWFCTVYVPAFQLAET